MYMSAFFKFSTIDSFFYGNIQSIKQIYLIIIKILIKIYLGAVEMNLLNKKNKKTIKGILIVIDKDFLNEILTLQEKVILSIENKEIYFSSTKEDLLNQFNSDSYFLGIKNLENNELIAFGSYLNKGLNKDNYAYDLDFDKNKILRTGQIDTTIVHPDFRGNNLQKILCKKLEEYSRKNGDLYLTATVSPVNLFSLNTFLKLGYENKKEKLKYDGMARCILCKVLS